MKKDPEFERLLVEEQIVEMEDELRKLRRKNRATEDELSQQIEDMRNKSNDLYELTRLSKRLGYKFAKK